MHPAIITGTVCSSWTWLWGIYHVAQNVFLVFKVFSRVSLILSDWDGYRQQKRCSHVRCCMILACRQFEESQVNLGNLWINGLPKFSRIMKDNGNIDKRINVFINSACCRRAVGRVGYCCTTTDSCASRSPRTQQRDSSQVDVICVLQTRQVWANCGRYQQFSRQSSQ